MLAYTDSYVHNKMQEWISHIERCRIAVRNEFEEMDFHNADARQRMEVLVDEIENECVRLIRTINSI